MSDEAKVTTGPPNAGEIARLAMAREKWRGTAGRFEQERDRALKELGDLRKEFDDFKASNGSTPQSKRIAELEGRIRERDHRDAFDRVAKAKGVKPEALKDAWTLCGYKAETDAVDESAIESMIEAQRTERAFLFGEVKGGESGDPAPIGRKAPGSDVGGRQGTPPGAIMAADDPRWSDPKYVMQNFEKISENARERIARGEI